MQPEFVLSQRDGRPMYQQIIEQVRMRIAVGTWPPGHRLPSIRELAVAARVSVITVKRAYQELESAGVIVTRQGMGSFVAEEAGLDRRLKDEELDRHLRSAVDAARTLGLDGDALKRRLDDLLAEAPDAPGDEE